MQGNMPYNYLSSALVMLVGLNFNAKKGKNFLVNFRRLGLAKKHLDASGHA
jgi:hypothetical protein